MFDILGVLLSAFCAVDPTVNIMKSCSKATWLNCTLALNYRGKYELSFSPMMERGSNDYSSFTISSERERKKCEIALSSQGEILFFRILLRHTFLITLSNNDNKFTASAFFECSKAHCEDVLLLKLFSYLFIVVFQFWRKIKWNYLLIWIISLLTHDMNEKALKVF